MSLIIDCLKYLHVFMSIHVFVTYCIVARLTVIMCVHVHVYKSLVNVSKSVRPKLNLLSCIIPLVVAAAVPYIHVCVKPTCIYHYVLNMTLVYTYIYINFCTCTCKFNCGYHICRY